MVINISLAYFAGIFVSILLDHIEVFSAQYWFLMVFTAVWLAYLTIDATKLIERKDK